MDTIATERKCARNSPLWHWMLLLALVFYAAHGAFSFQSVSGLAPRGQSGYAEVRDRGVFGLILLPGIVYLTVIGSIWSERRLIFSLAKRFKMLTLLGVLPAVSALWSQDPMRSLLFGMFYLLCTLFGYYLVIRFDPAAIMVLLMQTGTVVFLISFILIIFFPQYGLSQGSARVAGDWRGMFLDRTSAAKCLVFLLSPALLSRSVPFRYRLAYIVATGTAILCTHAMTPWGVLLGYAIFVSALKAGRRLEKKAAIIVIGGWVTVAFIIVSLGFHYQIDVLQIAGRDPTLSGRTLIWTLVNQSILARPFLGYGFYAFWQTPTSALANVLHAAHWSFGYAHNGYLEIALQLGALGIAIFAMTLFHAIKDSWLCVSSGAAAPYDWCAGLVLLTILYNLDEATVVWPNELLSVLYVVACCCLAQGRAEIEQRRKASLPDGDRLSLA